MKWLRNLIQQKVDQYHNWKEPDRTENPVRCPEMNIPVEPDLYNKFLTEATAAGATLLGSVIMFKGCTFDFNYDATASMLHVTPVHLPFYISCSQVESHIKALVEKSKGELT